MATKTTSKTKTAAPRKTATPTKPAASKAKLAPKKKEPETKPAPRTHPAAPSAVKTTGTPAKSPPPPATPRKSVASVSLIDKQPPHKKLGDGEIKKKSTVLPPISRIRASLEAPPAPLKPAAPPPEPPLAQPEPA